MRLRQTRSTLSRTAFAFLLFSTKLRAQSEHELPHPQTLAELHNAMQDVVTREHLPGAGFAFVANGELLSCGGIGKADLGSGRDITCDTEFRVGSISKTFVALALLKLQETGKINLEARLEDVAPEIPVQNPWASTHPVRVVNLLEHTAGFDDMEAAEVYNRTDPYDFPMLEVFQRFKEPQDVRWPPGTRMSYSNPGYGIAGYLIEKIAGMPFDQYIRENILRPLGMSNADFRFTDSNKGLLATGYKDSSHSGGYPYIYLRPAGDLKASAGELAKLVQFFLRRGRIPDAQIVKPESIMRMESVETTLAAKNGLRLGYGLANYTEVTGGVVTHGHDGSIEGFISSYRYMPEQNWGYVVLLNSTQSEEALRDLNTLSIDFLSKGSPKPQQATVSVASAELKKLAGFYVSRAPRLQLFSLLDDFSGVRIRLVNGQLVRSSLFGAPETLVPLGKNLFRGEREPEATTVFVPLAGGKMALSNAAEGFSYGERTSILWTWARIALLILCVVLMLSSLPFAVVWILRKLFRAMKDVRHLSVRVMPLLATLCFLGLCFCVAKLPGINAGEFSVWSAGIFLLSLLFPLLAIYGLWLALRVPKTEIRSGVRIHSLLVSLASCIVAGFLLHWHLIGLRLWAAH